MLVHSSTSADSAAAIETSTNEAYISVSADSADSIKACTNEAYTSFATSRSNAAVIKTSTNEAYHIVKHTSGLEDHYELVDVGDLVSTIVPTYCEIDIGHLCSHPLAISTLTGKTTEDLVYEVIPGEN